MCSTSSITEWRDQVYETGTAAADPHSPINSDSHHQPLVMVVEDDEDSRFMMRTLLEMNGYRVVEAQDGQEALEVAARARPELILTDLQLPRLNGIEVTRRSASTRSCTTCRSLFFQATTHHDIAPWRSMRDATNAFRSRLISIYC